MIYFCLDSIEEAKKRSSDALKKRVVLHIPYELEADTFMPDWHLIAEHLTKGTEHYVGYYSALALLPVVYERNILLNEALV